MNDTPYIEDDATPAIGAPQEFKKLQSLKNVTQRLSDIIARRNIDEVRGHEAQARMTASLPMPRNHSIA